MDGQVKMLTMSAQAKKDSFLVLSSAQYSSWIVALEPAVMKLGGLGTA